MSLKMVNIYVFGRCSVREVTQFRRYNIFRNLKLEISLALPASIDENTIETIQQDKGYRILVIDQF